MNNVTNATRAGMNGKKIACPKCSTTTTVYHFAWSEIRCPPCGADIKKTEWIVVDEDPNNASHVGSNR
jgi:ribosomal protein S27E